MGLNRVRTNTLEVHKMLTCDYCFTRYAEHEGVYSEDGDYCTQVCLELEATDRADLYYELDADDVRLDLAIDAEREKGLEA